MMTWHRCLCGVLAGGLSASCAFLPDSTDQSEHPSGVSVAAISGPTKITITLPKDVQLRNIAVGSGAVALKLGDRVQLLSGLGNAALASGGTQKTWLGTDVVTRDVVSNGVVELRDRAKVNGNLTSSVRPIVSPNGALITGTTVVTPLTPLQVISWTTVVPSTSSGDVRLEPDQQRSISPGRYGVLSIKSRARLTLAAGSYYVDSLQALEPGATLNISGPVVMYVADALVYRGMVTSSLPGTPPFMAVYQGTNPVTIENAFSGHIIAPKARLVLGASGQQHVGSFYAKDIEIYPDVKVRHQPNDLDFDGDGLTFLDELTLYGTDPFVADTDQDGLADGDEVAYWKSRTDGISWNSDVEVTNSARPTPGDGIINLLDPDSDNDGLLDGAEVVGWPIIVTKLVGGVPGSSTVTVSSDPTMTDSDADGLPDKLEHDGWIVKVLGVDRLARSNTSAADTDDDTISDAAEKIRYQSDPANSITYGTQYPDAQRAASIDEIGISSLDPPCDMVKSGAMENVFIYDFREKFRLDTPTANYTSRLDVYLPAEIKGKKFKIYIQSEDDSGNVVTTDTFSNMRLKTPDGSERVVAPGPAAGAYVFDVDPGVDGYGTFIATSDFNVANGSAYHAWAVDEDSNYVPLAWEDGPVQVDLQVKFHTKGDAPAYLRGVTYGPGNGDSESYVDNVRLDGKLIYQQSFNGGDLDFPLGSLPEGNYTLTMQWHYSGAPAKQWTHICEHGADWNKVQIAYDFSAHTKEYEAWKTGIATNEAIVRQGTSFFVLVEDASIGDTANPTITVLRQGSNIGDWGATRVNNYTTEEATPRHRQTWKITVPGSVAAGEYAVSATRPGGGGVIGSANFAVIFNPYTLRDGGLITNDELRAYSYDEGSALAKAWLRDQKGFWGGRTWQLGSISQAVTNLAIGAIDGKTNLTAAADSIRQLSNALIIGDWTGKNPNVYYGVTTSIPDALVASGATRDQVKTNSVVPVLTGQCFDFGGIAAALSRSAGLVNRMIFADSPYIPQGLWDNLVCDPTDNTGPTNDDTKRWNYHVWDEVMLTETSGAGDHWRVLDATDCAGLLTGGVWDRVQYGTTWSPRTVCAENVTEGASGIPVWQAYGISQPTTNCR